MPDAVTTVLAVLVGGVLTYFVQARLDERKGKRERERDEEALKREQDREQAAEAAEFRVARRLLLEELDTVALHHAMLADVGHYPLERAAQVMFPTETWASEMRTLAKGLSDDDEWNALTRFMHTVSRVKILVLAGEPHAAINAELVEQFRDGAIFARDLYEMLAGVPAPSVNERGGSTSLSALQRGSL